MRPTLREDILDTTIALFNAQGYANVTLRDISGALGVSVGNLNYYFQKKQDLLAAIMERNLLTLAPQGPVTDLEQFQALWQRMLDSLHRYAFYFRDPGLAKLHPKGGENIGLLRSGALEALKNLQKLGYFTAQLTGERQEQLVRVLMLSHLGWAQQGEQDMAAFLADHWALLEPYFTEKGHREYRQRIVKGT